MHCACLLTSTAGVLSSPNYPDMFPSNFDRTEAIEVGEGQVVGIQFKELNLCDGESFLTIRDGDGTTLLDVNRYQKSLPENISSISSRVLVSFKTRDVSLGYRLAKYSCAWEMENRLHAYNVGWSLSWRAMTPGVIHDLYFTLS